MKTITASALTILAVALLAPAATAQEATGTFVTAAASGTFPAGSAYNGVSLEAIHLSAGVDVTSEETTGRFNARLVSPAVLGVTTTILVEGTATSGSRVDANTATFAGTCSVTTGSVRVDGVPFVATVTSNPEGHGTVGLVLGTTTLPTAAVDQGSITIKNID